MRIAYLSTFYPFRGGIAQFNANLYKAFETNHEIKAFTFSRQYPDLLFPGKTQYVSKDDIAEIIEADEILDTINPISYLKTAKAIQQFNPDILVMKYWMTFFAPSLGTVAKMMPKSCKVITILDNVIPHERRFFDHIFNRYFIAQNFAFVAMSQKVKNDLLFYNPNAKHIVKDHPLYDHFGKKLDKQQACAQLGIPNDKKIVLFFGIIRDYKGLDILIDAFKDLDEIYHLVIAGESYGSFEKYAQQIEQNQLKNISVFDRYIDDNEVPAFFSAADVNVLPYKSATQSGITSIAYHFDLPQIATNVGGLPEIIHHNKTGIITEEVSAVAIKNAIQHYFENNLAQQFKPEIEQFKKSLTWESFAQSIIELAK